MIRRLFSLGIPLLIAAVLVNDCGRYLQAKYDLGNVTRNATDECAAIAKQNQDRTASWQAGEKYAEHFGAEIYGFDLQNGVVHVWTRMPVRGTWVLQRAMGYLDHKPQATLLVDDELTTNYY